VHDLDSEEGDDPIKVIDLDQVEDE